MNYIFFLFSIQTVLLVTWFNLPYPIPIMWKVDMNVILFNFCQANYYQFLNVGFIIALFFQERKSMLAMIRFIRSRMDWVAGVVVLFYIALLIAFFIPYNIEFLYKGWIVVIVGLLAILPRLFPKYIFLNPRGYKKSEMSFLLRGKGGDTLPINSPETSIFIVGAAGSGKTKSVLEPIEFEMIKKGYAGVLYDYAFSPEVTESFFSLSHLAYNSIVETKSKAKFFSVNFQDLSTSARFNPIAPDLIKDRENLTSCMKTLFLNLSPDMAQREDFWQKSAQALFVSIIVYLSNQHPSSCTLPHAILLALEDHNLLFAALGSDDEALRYARTVINSRDLKAGEQLAGVISTLHALLQDLINKKVFWILSGSDIPPVINDLEKPCIVALGNTPTKKNVISPVLSVIISTLIDQMYGTSKNKSFVIIDELPTIILPQLSEIPATGRKDKISTVVALQNKAQLVNAYKRDGADEIQASFSNHFIGRVGDQASAEEASKMMGKKEVEKTSTTTSDQRDSKTIQTREEAIITPQQVMSLKAGEFIGKLFHSKEGFFHIKLAPLEEYINPKNFKPLPVVYPNVDVEENFLKIQGDVTRILAPFKLKNTSENIEVDPLTPSVSPGDELELT